MDKMTVVELELILPHVCANTTLKEKLTVIEADAMRFDFSTLMGKAGRCIFGNLLYNISTSLIFHPCEFADCGRTCTSCCKGSGTASGAGLGSKAYGRLSVMTQYYCQVVPVLKWVRAPSSRRRR